MNRSGNPMPDSSDDTGRRVADTIHGRVGAGRSELVAGWQRMLADLLEKMAPYLSPGRLVTFHNLWPEEKTFFEALHRAVSLPAGATALFISPSHKRRAGTSPGFSQAAGQPSAIWTKSPTATL